MASHRPSHKRGITTGAARRLAAILVVVATALGLMGSPASAAPTSPTPIPAPSIAPSPQVSWISPPSPPAGVDECGWMDVGCKINQAVNGWFTALVRDAINPAFAMVGRLLLSSPPPSLLSRVGELTGQVTMVANALLVLFVLAGGMIVMSYGSVQTSTTAKEIVPRLVIATILVNGSLTISEYAVQLANGLVDGLVGTGVDAERAGNLLAAKATAIVTNSQHVAFYLVLIAGITVLLGLVLGFITIIRITLLLFLIIAGPLALLCHALPQTEGIAKLWWRALAGVLLMQVLQALVLLLAFKIHLTESRDVFTPGLAGSADQPSVGDALDVLIMISLLYVLIKIPGWVARSIWQQAKPQLLMRMVKAVVVYKTLGALGGAVRKARSGSSAQAVTAHRQRPAARSGRPRGASGRGAVASGSYGTGPRRSIGAPHTSGGSHAMNQHAPGNTTKAPTSSSSHGPQQLGLPLGVTPTPSPRSARQARQGRQLALPFPVTRVPRPTPPTPVTPPVSGTWIRPRPPYVQDMLPGMPTRPARPRQLRLRLDLPPRPAPRRGEK